MIDYHVHTCFSHDASYSPREQLDAAAKAGVRELCFTDHVDYESSVAFSDTLLADIGTLKKELVGIQPMYKGVRVKLGAELGLADAESAKMGWEHLKPHNLDFIIGSVHVVNGTNVYYPEYFTGKTKQDAYIAYLQTILACIEQCDCMSVLGHYDFVTKYAPFTDRRMTLDVSKELFEAIFKSLIEHGKGIEINTSAWREDRAWGLDILRLYKQLGGEFVTTGSDAHTPVAVARRLREAGDIAFAAGIKYFATYDGLSPSMHPFGVY